MFSLAARQLPKAAAASLAYVAVAPIAAQCDTAREAAPVVKCASSPPLAKELVAQAAPVATSASSPPLAKKLVAEAIGTGFIVSGGCGVVAAAMYAGSTIGPGGISAVCVRRAAVSGIRP